MFCNIFINIKRYALLVSAVVLTFFLLSGCDFLSGLFSKQDEKVRETYVAYKQAIQSGDIEALRKLIAKEKAKDLETANAPEMMALIKSLYPPQSDITGIEVKGASAIITLTAPSEGTSMQGKVTLVKEDGSWKIQEEHWEMKMSMDSTQSKSQAVTEVTRPYEYNKLIGTWKGLEAGYSQGEWEFIFGNDYVVSVKGPHGEAYRGSACSRTDIGETDGGIKVLYGGAVFDVTITEAPDSQQIGKISLGSYKLSGDNLQFCGGEPGLMKRTSDFGTADGIRCFELRKVQ